MCAVLHKVSYRGHTCGVAQECFATAQDAYLLLGWLPESASDLDTADGRPATKKHARSRIARMLCANESEFHHGDAAKLAEEFYHIQRQQIQEAIIRVCQSSFEQTNESGVIRIPDVVVVSGAGEFLARRIIDDLSQSSNRAVTTALRPRGDSDRSATEIVSLAEQLGPALSLAAAAHALAVLASEPACNTA
jgi:hypothetical protein